MRDDRLYLDWKKREDGTLAVYCTETGREVVSATHVTLSSDANEMQRVTLTFVPGERGQCWGRPAPDGTQPTYEPEAGALLLDWRQVDPEAYGAERWPIRAYDTETGKEVGRLTACSVATAVDEPLAVTVEFLPGTHMRIGQPYCMQSVADAVQRAEAA